MINIKPIYDKMVNSFVSDAVENINISKNEYNQLLDIKIEVDLIVESIKNITIDESIDPNDKYILINQELDKIQKKTKKISDIGKIKSDRENKLSRDKSILIETCLDNHSDMNEKDLNQYIIDKISNKTD